MFGGINKKVDILVEKSFLQAVEKSGKVREEVVVKDICDALQDIFGEPGSAH